MPTSLLRRGGWIPCLRGTASSNTPSLKDLGHCDTLTSPACLLAAVNCSAARSSRPTARLLRADFPLARRPSGTETWPSGLSLVYRLRNSYGVVAVTSSLRGRYRQGPGSENKETQYDTVCAVRRLSGKHPATSHENEASGWSPRTRGPVFRRHLRCFRPAGRGPWLRGTDRMRHCCYFIEGA